MALAPTGALFPIPGMGNKKKEKFMAHKKVPGKKQPKKAAQEVTIPRFGNIAELHAYMEEHKGALSRKQLNALELATNRLRHANDNVVRAKGRLAAKIDQQRGLSAAA